ncbi:MAG: hypothetical protein M1829_003960 [Trizodia sp. TS-e1964]|nr:MAG: hypothetical protein M1829_003960 [Trizodia sp. TS-e1964]
MSSKPKDRPKERDKDRKKEKERNRSPRRRRNSASRLQRKASTTATPEPPPTPLSSSSRHKNEMLGYDVNGSATLSRSSLPYPSFSKEHSRESLGRPKSVDNLPTPKFGPPTPDPTDLGGGPSALKAQSSNTVGSAAPPSPPPTVVEAEKIETAPAASKSSTPTPSQDATSKKSGSKDDGVARQKKKSSRSKKPESEVSRKSSHRRTKPSSRTSSLLHSVLRGAEQKSQAIKSEPIESQVDNGSERLSSRLAESTLDSEATSVIRDHRPVPNPDSINIIDASSTTTFQDLPHEVVGRASEDTSNVQSYRASHTINHSFPSHSPLPPPPPPIIPINIPKVDYLLQNGGLSNPIPRTLFAVSQPNSPFPQTPSFPHHVPSRFTSQPSVEIGKVFAPYHSLLNDYSTVINKNGSLAVATGYRSVARRLLSRLEGVFARDLSSESCFCCICQQYGQHEAAEEEIGWGDVLEWVSGRRDLPSWPVFDFDSLGNITDPALTGLGISEDSKNQDEANRSASPVPKIDIDVPEEFREHYVRQSKKTKQAVGKWLSSCPANPSSPPEQIDDETLTFVLLTHLDPAQRSLFNTLLTAPGSSYTPDSRAPTPLRPRSELLIRTGFALQRLYRLPVPPRDPESAIFLLKHHRLHQLLAAISAINASEWSVLTSGRFDGFLWSGADADIQAQASPGLSRGPSRMSRGVTPANGTYSRTTTPFSPSVSRGPAAYAPSRGPTPFSPAGPPVPHDEETEIAVLAEIEREIYIGMEALEDAFEALHAKAEQVRSVLRERAAGLSMAESTRKGNVGGGRVEIVSGTPCFSPGRGGWGDSESEAGEIDDEPMDIRPEDSASNISSNRVRRPKRRVERRTPAPVEEAEDE